MLDSERYLKMREEAKGLPRVSVSKDKFIEMLVESGMDALNAGVQATLAEVLGSYARIGDRMVGIKGEGDDEEGKLGKAQGKT